MYVPLPGQPFRCKDWEGLQVEPTRELRTNGGSVFPVGKAFTVCASYQGKFSLKSDAGDYITGISAASLTIVSPIPQHIVRIKIPCRGCGKRLDPFILERCQCPGNCYQCGAELTVPQDAKAQKGKQS